MKTEITQLTNDIQYINVYLKAIKIVFAPKELGTIVVLRTPS